MATTTTTDMRAAAAKFFTASTFAVSGASSNPAKFGHKIFAWYIQHGLHAIPSNPAAASIDLPSTNQSYKTIASPKDIPEPANTSLSIITPPPVTAKLLREAKEVGVRAVWLQPGTFTDAEMEYALREFPGAAVGGFAEGTVGGEGWCVLVDGEEAMAQAEKLGGRDSRL